MSSFIENLPFSAADWEQLRIRFQSSMMVETELFKLAQNVDATWPIRHKDETPMKYLHFSLEELTMLPEFMGKMDRLPLLYSILTETLAFDDPFGDMADYVDSSSKKDDSALKALRSLEIPTTFPLYLANLSDETASFCKNEEIRTVEQLVAFSQNMAQSIVVGGEFRSFLNSLTHLDTNTLRKFLPIRDGKSGLYLAESLAHLASKFSPAEAAALLREYNLTVDRQEWNTAKGASRIDLNELRAHLEQAVDQRFQFFPDQAQQLRHAHSSGEAALLRFFAPLNDPDYESLSRAIALVYLKEKPRQKGFIKRFFS